MRHRSVLPLALLLAESIACTRHAPLPGRASQPNAVAVRSDSTSRQDSGFRRVAPPHRDTLSTEMRLMRSQDSAHTAIMEKNGRQYEKMRARLAPETCPPDDVYRVARGSRGARRDSVRGVIRICQYRGRPRATLIVSYDSTDIALIGHQDALTQMENLSVEVFGRRSTTRGGWQRVEVHHEYIRANGGAIEALDGTLRRERAGDFLELPDGRRLRIPKLPDGLAAANGLRIYIAGPLDDPVQSDVIRTRTHRDPTPR